MTGDVGTNNNSKNITEKNRNGHVKQNSSDGSVASVSTYQSWDNCVPVPELSAPQAAVTVFILAVMCFANSLYGEFVFDDNEAILGNKDLLAETPLQNLFFNDFWGKKLVSSTSHKSYRPLTVLTFRLNHYLAGGLDPMGFHLANILLHGVVSVLFLPVFSILIGGYFTCPNGAPVFRAPRASLLSAILFAVHPIHTESVAGVVGRADLLCALLYLLSFLCYIKTCHSGHLGVNIRPESYSPFWLLSSVILCALSVLCKEQGITVIGLCSAYDIIQVCRINIFTIFKRPDEKLENCNNNVATTTERKSYPLWLRSVIYRHCFLLLSGVILLAVRWKVMGSAPPTFQVMDNPHSFVNGTLLRVLNYNYLYALNGWLLIYPWWLCFDWSMGCVPVITTVTDPRILAVFAFWVVFAVLILSSWKDNIHHNERVLLLGLAFLIIPFLPATNLLFRVGFVVAERVLYLSTAGFCLLVTMGVQRLAQNFPQYIPAIRCCLVLLVSIMIGRCVQRSNDWRTETLLFTAGAQVCPLNAKVHYNIAKVVADQGDGDYAIRKYRQAIQLNPEYDQAMNNLGNILKDRGENQEALSLLTQAVQVRPEFAAAWMNLGIVQTALGQNHEAERSYFTAIQHRRNYPDCYYNLGNLYLDTNRHREALMAWRNATLLKPTHINSWSNMMILLSNLNRLSEAETVGKEALQLLPDSSSLHFNMANNFGKLEKYGQSERHFLRAIELDDGNPRVHSNLGVLYHRWEKPGKAEKAYLRAIELEPSKTEPGSARDNLQMLYRQKGKGPYKN